MRATSLAAVTHEVSRTASTLALRSDAGRTSMKWGKAPARRHGRDDRRSAHSMPIERPHADPYESPATEPDLVEACAICGRELWSDRLPPAIDGNAWICGDCDATRKITALDRSGPATHLAKSPGTPVIEQ
jgi:hypothetical protein